MDIALILLGSIGYSIPGALKSMKTDEQAMKKNIKAATKTAEAMQKVEQAQKHLIERLQLNATRKNAILNCHFKLFQEQYAVIEKIDFRPGEGIQQLNQINSINQQLTLYISQPAVASGGIIKESQQMITFALLGVGGLLVQDSNRNLELAKRNMSQANAVAAQADAICIAYNGIANHVDIITKLLQDLGALYIRAIKNLEQIFAKNGMVVENYSDQDIEHINITAKLTEVIFNIIDTPVIDNEGEIEKASIAAISSGEEILNKINGGQIL